VEILSALSSSATLAQEILSGLGTVSSDVRDQVSKLTRQLAGIQVTAASLVADNARQRAELSQLLSPLKLQLSRNSGYYNSSGEGPYCPRCYETSRHAVLMSEQGQMLWDIVRWRCNRCHRETGGRAGAASKT